MPLERAGSYSQAISSSKREGKPSAATTDLRKSSVSHYPFIVPGEEGGQ